MKTDADENLIKAIRQCITQLRNEDSFKRNVFFLLHKTTLQDQKILLLSIQDVDAVIINSHVLEQNLFLEKKIKKLIKCESVSNESMDNRNDNPTINIYIELKELNLLLDRDISLQEIAKSLDLKIEYYDEKQEFNEGYQPRF